MYIACGGEANANRGTTNLHVDVADAVNFVTWTNDPQLTAAVWHIFPRDVAPLVSNYIRDTRPDLGELDPIQGQLVFLTENDLDCLGARYKVAPWVVHQRAGDMLFIPAGCAHQVCYHAQFMPSSNMDPRCVMCRAQSK